MRKLILGAAVLTALPLLASKSICLPTVREPVHLFGLSGGVILLDPIRLL